MQVVNENLVSTLFMPVPLVLIAFFVGFLLKFLSSVCISTVLL